MWGVNMFNSIEVKRINKEYVGDSCVQVMFTFFENNNIGIGLEEEDTQKKLFEYDPKNNIYINEYLNDPRRKEFPYGNIPVHKEPLGCIAINQILDYNKTYIKYRKSDYKLKEENSNYIKILKDNDSALLIETNDKQLVSKFNVEQIKNLETLGQLKIVNQTNPIVFRISNTNIPREEIKKAKRLVKEKRAK